MQVNELKEYIKNIYQLEVSLYNQNTLMTQMRNEIGILSDVKNEPFEKEISENQWEFIFSGLVSAAEIAGGIIVVYVIINFFRSYKSFETFLFRLMLWAGIPFVIIVCGVLILAYFDYSEIKERNNRIRIQNQRIKEINAQNRSETEKKVAIYNIALEKRKQLYLETEDLLDKYYQKDVIFPKYRELIPISSFYEYLISGRCDCLEGHEGAYNIYENELRQNIIIDKLDDIIHCLEQIKRNQYMLYSAITEGNRKIQKLGDDVYRTMNSLHNIENSTALTAYNSEIIAENSKLLTWIELYKR